MLAQWRRPIRSAPLLLLPAAVALAPCAAPAAPGEKPAGPAIGTPLKGADAEELGSKDAKVTVEAIVPIGPECQARTVRMLRALAKAEPKRVLVKIVDYTGEEGQDLVKARGTNCASVFVNGDYTFDLKVPGKPDRHVEFWHKPNDPDSLYRSEDVVDVVGTRLAEAYGTGLAEGVAEKVKAAGAPAKAPAASSAPAARLVVVGAGKAAAQTLSELRKEQAGRLLVVEVKADAAARRRYRVRRLPTLVLYDSRGKELARREGPFTKADILAALRRAKGQ